MTQLTISIVILTMDRTDAVARLLDALGKQKVSCVLEVIIIDQNTRVEPLYLEQPNRNISLKIVHAGRNLGVAGGRNLGALHSTGTIIAFFDDDILVTDALFLQSVLDIFAKNADLIAINAQVVRKDLTIHKTEFVAKSQINVAHLIGACFFINVGTVSKAVLHDGQIFDENYNPYGFEEIDLAWRIISKSPSGIVNIYPKYVIHLKDDRGRLIGDEALLNLASRRIYLAKKLLPYLIYLSNICVWGGYCFFRTGHFPRFIQGIDSRRKTSKRIKLKLLQNLVLKGINPLW